MAGSDWSLVVASGSGLLLLFAVLKSLVGLTLAVALTSKPRPPIHLIPWHLLNCFSGRLFWNARAREMNIKINKKAHGRFHYGPVWLEYLACDRINVDQCRASNAFGNYLDVVHRYLRRR